MTAKTKTPAKAAGTAPQDRREHLRFLLETHGIPFGALDSYHTEVTRELREGRKLSSRSAGKIARALWGLREKPETSATPKPATEALWKAVTQDLSLATPPTEADFVSRFCHWVCAPPPTGPATLTDQELIDSFRPFLRKVAKDCSEVVTRGIKIDSDAQPLRLAYVYVSLDTKSPRPEKKGGKRPRGAERDQATLLWGRSEEGRPLSALEALFDPATTRVVLTGEPGSGKSTFLQYVTLCLADRISGPGAAGSYFKGLESPELLRAQAGIPLRILLRDFAPSLPPEAQGGSEDVVKFLSAQLLSGSHTAAAENLPELLRRGLAFVLFDGLDEVPRGQIPAVRAAIAAFAAGEYQKCRAAVTCRTASYQRPEFQLGGFPPPQEIATLSEDLRRRFVQAWYREMEEARPQFRGEGATCAASLIIALSTERLKEMSGNPFFLTAMAALHRPDNPLPETGAQLMDELVRGVLEESRKRRADADPGAKPALSELASLLRLIPNGFELLRSRLELVAYLAREKRQDNGQRLIDEDLLRNRLVLARDLPARWVDDLLDALRHRAGLLQSQDGEHFEFAYRFEEFLAGCHLTNEDAWQTKEPSFPRRARALLDAQSDYGRLPVLWAAGFNAHVRRRKGPVRDLISALTPKEPVTDEARLASLEQAADIAHDAGLETWLDDDVPDSAETARRLRARLREVRDNPRAFAAPIRSRAGSAIGRLGDDRPGVGLRAGLPDIEWISIPAGPFKMGSKGKEFTCHLLDHSPYKISRYPITVAQYHAFVKDGGYTKEFFAGGSEEKDRVWTRAGWEWLQQKKILGPEDYDPVYQTPNHPRVGVSWYEASAFCRWLTLRLRALPPKGLLSPLPATQEIVLPSEAEWERAARGKDGRICPWGDEEDVPERCNVYETQIKHTSPVGLFPTGDTPSEGGNALGLADMAGNVWEWGRTLWLDDYQGYEKKVSDDPDAEGGRVLRGAGWSTSSSNAVSARRYRFGPDDRGNDFGFRCVWLSERAR